MAYSSALEEVLKRSKIKCPKCKSIEMRYMSHLKMYGGYVCKECGSIWSINHPEIKKQQKSA